MNVFDEIHTVTKDFCMKLRRSLGVPGFHHLHTTTCRWCWDMRNSLSAGEGLSGLHCSKSGELAITCSPGQKHKMWLELEPYRRVGQICLYLWRCMTFQKTKLHPLPLGIDLQWGTSCVFILQMSLLLARAKLGMPHTKSESRKYSTTELLSWFVPNELAMHTLVSILYGSSGLNLSSEVEVKRG